MNRLHARTALTLGLCATSVVVITACGSTKHPAATSSSGVGVTPSSSAASGATPALEGSPADAATTTAVTTTFVTAFNGAAPIASRLVLLQNESAFEDGLTSSTNAAILSQTSATVSKVTLVNPNRANVLYTVLLSGVAAAANQIGTAVMIDGSWKVSASTFCTLLTAGGQAPSACTSASVTAFPS